MKTTKHSVLVSFATPISKTYIDNITIRNIKISGTVSEEEGNHKVQHVAKTATVCGSY